MFLFLFIHDVSQVFEKFKNYIANADVKIH